MTNLLNDLPPPTGGLVSYLKVSLHFFNISYDLFKNVFHLFNNGLFIVVVILQRKLFYLFGNSPIVSY